MSKRGDRTWRVVRGALTSMVNDHGPITLDNLDSAAKRIVAQIRQTPGTLQCEGDDVAATKIDHLQKQLHKLRHGHAITINQLDRCRGERNAAREHLWEAHGCDLLGGDRCELVQGGQEGVTE